MTELSKFLKMGYVSVKKQHVWIVHVCRVSCINANCPLGGVTECWLRESAAEDNRMQLVTILRPLHVHTLDSWQIVQRELNS